MSIAIACYKCGIVEEDMMKRIDNWKYVSVENNALYFCGECLKVLMVSYYYSIKIEKENNDITKKTSNE